LRNNKQEYEIVYNNKILFVTSSKNPIQAIRDFRKTMANTWYHLDTLKIVVRIKK
jgi:hypothetical protein